MKKKGRPAGWARGHRGAVMRWRPRQRPPRGGGPGGGNATPHRDLTSLAKNKKRRLAQRKEFQNLKRKRKCFREKTRHHGLNFDFTKSISFVRNNSVFHSVMAAEAAGVSSRAELALAPPTLETVEALREQLLPTLPFGQVLSVYVHGTPAEVLRECTRWSVLREARKASSGDAGDSSGRRFITGMMGRVSRGAEWLADTCSSGVVPRLARSPSLSVWRPGGS